MYLFYVKVNSNGSLAKGKLMWMTKSIVTIPEIAIFAIKTTKKKTQESWKSEKGSWDWKKKYYGNPQDELMDRPNKKIGVIDPLLKREQSVCISSIIVIKYIRRPCRKCTVGLGTYRNLHCTKYYYVETWKIYV